MAKAQKKKRKKGSLTGLLGKLAVAGASAYLVISFIGGQVQVAAKQRELEALEQALEVQTLQNKELAQLVESGDEDAYIERIAREKLGYAKPGERVFVDISGQ